jgi:hypothetical protein
MTSDERDAMAKLVSKLDATGADRAERVQPLIYKVAEAGKCEKEAAIRADLIAAKAGIMKLSTAHGLAWGPFSGSSRR